MPVSENLESKTQHSSLPALYRYLAARGEGRNRALFITSLAARDSGVPLEQTLKSLVDYHINQRGMGTHQPESAEVRRCEAENTIRSAYSRPARIARPRKYAKREQGGAAGLPNSVREALFERKYTCAVRLWEGLNHNCIHPGAVFTTDQAVALLKGVVGRDSVYNSLNTTLNSEPLFERLSPSGHPQASGDAAINTKTETPKKCVFGRAEKSGINPRGPKTRRFVMPSPLDWCRILSVQPTHSDPLTIEDLASARNTRMAAHRELIKRRPGVYPRRWLAGRLGVRVETIDSYNAAIPIHSRPQFSEKRIYWSNIRLVPDGIEVQIDGAFLEDATDKRYPAKRAIAAKLLAQGKSVTYKRQDANYYWYGDCPPDLGVLYGQPTPVQQPVPAVSAQYLNTLPQNLTDPAQGRAVQLDAAALAAQIGGHNTGFSRDSHPAAVHPSTSVGTRRASSAAVPSDRIVGRKMPITNGKGGKPPKPRRLPSGRRRLKNADHETLACRITERVNRLTGDAALHIGIATARRLVSQYDRALIDQTLNILEARQNIARPAGFFVTVLRSESRRHFLCGG
ncbi:MAG: hypothetical protein K8I30_19585 [Anaerolineae bacterium]|nr:hypothetical protein [Anaerolineae bacterium]